MKWFHHDVESHNDAFIRYLMKKYPRGYQVFFITLEIMGREFSPKSKEDANRPIIIEIEMLSRLNLVSTKLQKQILDECAKNPLNKNPWHVKYLDGELSGFVEIFSKKLKDNADTYTQHLLKKLKQKIEE